MNPFTKRVVLAVAAPLALASIVSGGVAFAASQSGSAGVGDTPAVIQQQAPGPTPAPPADPNAPTTPGGGNGTHNPANCPNMGGSTNGPGSSNSSGSTSGATQTSFRHHSRSFPGAM